MAEVLAVALAALAVGLSYGADGPRDVPRWALLRARGRAPAARVLALALIGLAVVLWNQAEPGPAAYLAVPLAVLATGTLLTLGAPLVLGRARRRSERPASRRPPAGEPLPDELPDTLGRSALVLGVILGTLPVALLASAAVARFLPVSADARFAAGFALAIPLWQLCMCIALLARRGATVLTVCSISSLVLAALVFGIQP